MKKLLFAAVAVSLIAGMTNCKKEDKTPTEIQDAQVVDTALTGDTTEVVWDVVDMEGNGVAVGTAEATETVAPADSVN